MFKSQLELISNVQRTQAQSGTVMSIKSSTWNLVVLRCVHGGEAKRTEKENIPDNQRRKSSSMKSGCPYEVRGGLQGEEWVLKPATGDHNHEVHEDVSGYSRTRILGKDDGEEADRLFAVGIPARKIKSIFLADGKDTITNRDLYNRKQKYNTSLLAGASELEALVQSLHSSGYSYNVWPFYRPYLTIVDTKR